MRAFLKDNRVHIERLILIKGAISIGLTAAYFLPPAPAIAVGISANLLWIWKV